MNEKLKKILILFGVKHLITLKNYGWFIRDYFKYKSILKKEKDNRFEFNFIDLLPCVNDKTSNTQFDRHYIWHTAWAIRKLKEINPSVHYDFSSSLYFVSMTSAFFNIKFYDYRPANLYLSNLSSQHADLSKLEFENETIDSLSCMHVVEHVGLGRYGDTLDINGDLKAISEISRVVKRNGNLLFVIPIGKPKIMFNAHRVYSYSQTISYFKDFNLIEFSLIPDYDKGDSIIYNASETEADKQYYGCGMFHFRKKDK